MSYKERPPYQLTCITRVPIKVHVTGTITNGVQAFGPEDTTFPGVATTRPIVLG